MSMKAVVFRGPFDVGIEQRPRSQLKDSTDAIVRVNIAGICGSELHMYRGHQQTGTGHIMGHEFVGIVEEIGSDVSSFQPGDEVVSIFSAVWGLTNRCINGTAFGTPLLDGGQAEYVRVPFADGTLQHAPTNLDRRLLIMMCDIFPTGYYGSQRAIEGLKTQYNSKLTSFTPKETHGIAQNGAEENEQNLSYFSNSAIGKIQESTIVVIGCGPVGICAIAAARWEGIKKVFAIDSVEDRLVEAASFGAIPILLGKDDPKEHIMKVTNNRGADAVVEVVGNKAALRSAFELLRPCGILSSVGFHQDELPFTALEFYQANITVNFGRVPVRTIFDDALRCLTANQDKMQNYISHELPLNEAARGYRIFEQTKARKVILKI
ncbi:hypothetical protein PENSTE_c010G08814 [Penicillium steckii]|uniref:Enoyl reductase (ER) domain-containing protein n=1 Tax=Penicillium steckii TaxID=303698 RepID=A0A1V6T879_9EURO|nr:hypothetical protein PENSTE_c010G08814 [Penicillium steckii]